MRVKTALLLLCAGLVETAPQCVAQAPTKIAGEAQRERDATAVALVRLISEAIAAVEVNGFDKAAFESKSSRWNVVYRPSSKDGFLLDAIRVQSDEEVEMPQSPTLPNAPMIAPTTIKAPPSFSLSVEPYLSPVEYARLQAKNREIYRQLFELDAQMEDIKRQHKSGRYLPADEAEKLRVKAYEKLEATLTRKFPDFYFRDISLSWSSGFSCGLPYGYNPEYILKTQDKTGWELEQAQVAQKVVKLMTRYENAAVE